MVVQKCGCSHSKLLQVFKICLLTLTAFTSNKTYCIFKFGIILHIVCFNASLDL